MCVPIIYFPCCHHHTCLLKSGTFSSLTCFFTFALSALGTLHLYVNFRIDLLISVKKIPCLGSGWRRVASVDSLGRTDPSCCLPVPLRCFPLFSGCFVAFCGQVFYALCHTDLTSPSLPASPKQKPKITLLTGCLYSLLLCVGVRCVLQLPKVPHSDGV